MKQLLLMAVCCMTTICYSQSVGIGTSTPDASAMLEVKSTDKGFLPPRLALTGTADVTTIASPATGLLVYNTATAGSGGTAVTPGYYYYNGTNWTLLLTGTGVSSWNITGNSGTVDGTHFIGTTDNLPLTIKVNNQLSGRIDHLKFNSFWGYQAGLSNTTGYGNTALGYTVLNLNSDGYNNTGIGNSALYHNTSGYGNTATGVASLLLNTTGNYNTANGGDALYSNTTGSYNVATGGYALYINTTGNDNTATGGYALYANTTGNNNTANGYGGLTSNTTGFNNTANGYEALFLNTTGVYNTADGVVALYSNTTGNYNTALGNNALYANTTGSSNTAIGYNTDVSTGTLSNATAIGASTIVDASNKVRIGNSSVTVIEGQVAFTNPSDGRFKFNIKEDVRGLDFIMQLRPVTYNFDVQKQDDFVKGKISARQLNNYVQSANYNEASFIRRTGFIAQEVEIAAKNTGYDFDGVKVPQTEKQYYSLSYASFVVPLVKGMQEQQKIIEEQDKKIGDLQKQIDELKKMMQHPVRVN